MRNNTLAAFAAACCVLLFSTAIAAQEEKTSDPMVFLAKGDFTACSALFERELATRKWPTAWSLYHAARCNAMAGRPAEALDLLTRAIDSPAFRFTGVASEPDLNALHDAPQWPALVAAAETKAAQGPVMGASVDVAHKKRHPVTLPKGKRIARGTETVLLVGVAADDTLDHVIIERSSGDPELDQIAAVAAARWKYHAGEADGIKYSTYVRLPIVFQP